MIDHFITVKIVSWEKTLHVKPVLRRVYIYTQSHVFKQDMLKCHVFMQDTNSQVMFFMQDTLFCKTRLLKPFLRHVRFEDVSLCLRLYLRWFYFLLFLLFNTRLLTRHVLYMMPRHHFYGDIKKIPIMSDEFRTISQQIILSYCD